MYHRLITASVITLGFLIVGCSSDDDASSMSTTAALPPVTLGVGNSVFDNIVNDSELSTLLLAINTAGLADTLDNEATPFTIFAPDNAAFEALGDANTGVDIDTLLSDPTTLISILTYHIVDGTLDFTAASENAPTDLPTLNGATVRLDVSDTASSRLSIGVGDIIGPNSSFDPDASVGVVHIIDTVLMPPPAE